MIRLTRPIAFLFAACLVCAGAGRVAALSDADVAAGRNVVKQSAGAVIGVEMVVTVKITREGRPAQPRENKVDINGTVVSASGLTVTSLAAVDPRIQFEAMRSMMPGAEIGETDYKEVKLRMADGTEVPARVVLKDADLDLAFIAPEAGADLSKHTFTPVNLGNSVQGQVLDTYFAVGRAAKVLQRVPMVRASEITGIVEKPRKLYLLTDLQLGCPVFDPAGRILGVSLQNLSGGRPSGMIVVPAADIAEVAKQAEAAQAAAAAAPAAPPAAGVTDAPAATAP